MASSLTDLLNMETMSTPAESPNPIRGIGGGLADLVPAEIDGQQPAALSEGEFVWPADIVSMLGDGSSEAGARMLQRLMDDIRSSKQNGDSTQKGSIADLLGS